MGKAPTFDSYRKHCTKCTREQPLEGGYCDECRMLLSLRPKSFSTEQRERLGIVSAVDKMKAERIPHIKRVEMWPEVTGTPLKKRRVLDRLLSSP